MHRHSDQKNNSNWYYTKKREFFDNNFTKMVMKITTMLDFFSGLNGMFLPNNLTDDINCWNHCQWHLLPYNDRKQRESHKIWSYTRLSWDNFPMVNFHVYHFFSILQIILLVCMYMCTLCILHAKYQLNIKKYNF